MICFQGYLVVFALLVKLGHLAVIACLLGQDSNGEFLRDKAGLHQNRKYVFAALGVQQTLLYQPRVVFRAQQLCPGKRDEYVLCNFNLTLIAEVREQELLLLGDCVHVLLGADLTQDFAVVVVRHGILLDECLVVFGLKRVYLLDVLVLPEQNKVQSIERVLNEPKQRNLE